MTEKNPAIFLQAGSHPAEDVRRMLDALLGEGTLTLEGVLGATDMAVSESDTPGMSVQVAGGRAWIQGDEGTYQGVYFVENRGVTSLVIAASDPTNPRIDRIVAEVDDSDYSGATDAWALKVLQGTPAGSPTAPAVPDNAISLATVAVAALASSIVDADITDTRSNISNPGYQLVRYTSSGTFTKANYPWAKSIKVTAVGGGGGGGGAGATTASQASAGGGGGGGATAIYAASPEDITSAVTVTVGAGGAGGVGAANGSNGNSSSFGAYAVAGGGSGGGFVVADTVFPVWTLSGDGGTASAGTLQIPGGGGTAGIRGGLSVSQAFGGAGGGTLLAPPTDTRRAGGEGPTAGNIYGGGGSGAANAASTSATNGGSGANGVVIVEIYG